MEDHRELHVRMPSRFFRRIAMGICTICAASLGPFFGTKAFKRAKKSMEGPVELPDFGKSEHVREAYQNLLSLTSLLDEFGVQYWAHDGTLLGAYRCRGILPHDDDVDIGITRSGMEAMDTAAFREAAATLGHFLTPRLGGNFGYFKFRQIDSVIPYRQGHNSISVDIFPFDDQHLVPCKDLWLRVPPAKDAPGRPAYGKRGGPWNEDMEWHRYGGWPVAGGEGELHLEKWTSRVGFQAEELCLPPMFGNPWRKQCVVRAKHVLPYRGDSNARGDADGAGDQTTAVFPFLARWPFGAFTIRGLENRSAEEYLKMCYGPDVITHKHVWDHVVGEEHKTVAKLEASDREPRRPFLPLFWPLFDERLAIESVGDSWSYP